MCTHAVEDQDTAVDDEDYRVGFEQDVAPLPNSLFQLRTVLAVQVPARSCLKFQGVDEPAPARRQLTLETGECCLPIVRQRQSLVD